MGVWLKTHDITACPHRKRQKANLAKELGTTLPEIQNYSYHMLRGCLR
jgi:hypothetical protein